MLAFAWFALLLLNLVWLLPALPAAGLPVEILVLSCVVVRLLGGRGAALVLLPVLLGLWQLQARLDERLAPALAGDDVLVRGTVCDFPVRSGRAYRFRFDLDDRGGARLPARIQVAWYNTDRPPQAGEHWQLVLRLREARGLHNPGSADSDRSQLVSGIGARAYVRPASLNRKLAARDFACMTGRWRGWLAERVIDALGDRRATGYLLALTVGARHRLADPEWEMLRRTGTVHLMAISGLHIGLVAALGAWLGRRCAWLARVSIGHAASAVYAAAGALLGALIYSALAGFTVPTIRALVMVAVAVLVSSWRRNTTAWQLLSAALYAVLLIAPLAILSPGFWLSFTAVAWLLLPAVAVDPSRPQAPGGHSPWVAAVRTQLRITAGLAPLGIGFFGQLSAIAPLANLIAIPAFAVAIVPLALFGMAMAAAGASDLPLKLAAFLVDKLLWLLDQLQVVWAPFGQVMPTPLWVLGLSLAGLLLLLGPRPRPSPVLALAMILPLAAGVAVVAPPAQLRVVVMDVGQGLAVLLQTRRHALVYDTGPAYGSGDAGRSVVLPVIGHFGLRRLDRIVVSHGDSDHAGGLASIRKQHPEAELLAPASIDGARACVAGDEWIWDGVRFRVLHPPADSGRTWSDNDGSCVLLVETSAASVLLPGDVSRRAERWLLRQPWLGHVDLVLAPHHGSKTSSGAPLVGRTRPLYTVFSAGYANRWGFPHPRVAARWRQAGACGLTTADFGALEFNAAPGEALRLTAASRLCHGNVWTRRPTGGDCADGCLPVKCLSPRL